MTGAMADNQTSSATPSASTSEPAKAHAPPQPTDADDSDPDFDDLDDVLDQFSANAPSQPSQQSPQVAKSTTATAPTASGPGRPNDEPFNLAEQSLPGGQKPGETEEEFVARLSAEMSQLFSGMAGEADTASQSPEDLVKMGKELEEFTRHMEEQGVKPEDLLKAIMGEEEGTKIANVAINERERRESEKETSRPTSSKGPKSSGKAGASFEDTIRQTMSRLNESDTQAKTATQESSNKSEEDMLAEMLKALDTGGGAGGEGGDEGISKMFLDMMHQLTHKSMLYEPMKELHDQYPDWLAKNKPPTIKQEDYKRYQRQSEIVRDITNKFEAPGFKDEDEECRQYIWDKMQQMQGEGAPPEELVKNPFPGTDFGAVPGLGGGGEGDEEGCPTQ